ncbi:MAG TPA: hypothetical protein VIH89_06355 [Candidatus Sulfotelmatobacter sp.]
MKAIPMHGQLILVGAGYAAVLAAATALVFARYMLYVRHPQDTAAAGGMYAGGDLILEVFIGCMFLFPLFSWPWLSASPKASTHGTPR